MIYHRPTRSGIYGVVSVFQPWRLALNDVTLTYTNNVDRDTRFKLAIQAYTAMFLRTEGAMTTTRLPHTEAFTGVVIYTSYNFPVPVISPLKEGYTGEVKSIAGQIGANVKDFNSMDEFVGIMKDLEGMGPWSG